jgi:hypothetical protein
VAREILPLLIFFKRQPSWDGSENGTVPPPPHHTHTHDEKKWFVVEMAYIHRIYFSCFFVVQNTKPRGLRLDESWAFLCVPLYCPPPQKIYLYTTAGPTRVQRTLGRSSWSTHRPIGVCTVTNGQALRDVQACRRNIPTDSLSTS